MYGRGGKGLRSLFKEYQDALPEGKGYMGFGIFHSVVKLLVMRGDSKAGLSTYNRKFHHGKNVFYVMLDRVGEMDLNDSSSIGLIFFANHWRKSENHYELLTW